ncbi:hypothetical protein J6590_094239, partial [Homalodisca vitripennis]
MHEHELRLGQNTDIILTAINLVLTSYRSIRDFTTRIRRLIICRLDCSPTAAG